MSRHFSLCYKPEQDQLENGPKGVTRVQCGEGTGRCFSVSGSNGTYLKFKSDAQKVIYVVALLSGWGQLRREVAELTERTVSI